MFQGKIKTTAALLALLSLNTVVLAQQAPASSTQENAAPSERVKRQADNPYKWIMILDDKPRTKKEEPRRAPAAARSDAPRPPASPPPPQTAAAASAAQQPTVIAPQSAPEPAPQPAATLADAAPAAPQPDAQDEPLLPLKQVQPEMTRQIASSGITQGRVRAKFSVAPDGSVTRPEIVSSSSRVLNSSVLAALAQWKYAPIKVARETQVEFSFDFSN